eukprot:5074406-Pyramimonas_sp.AAC.1
MSFVFFLPLPGQRGSSRSLLQLGRQRGDGEVLCTDGCMRTMRARRMRRRARSRRTTYAV